MKNKGTMSTSIFKCQSLNLHYLNHSFINEEAIHNYELKSVFVGSIYASSLAKTCKLTVT